MTQDILQGLERGSGGEGEPSIVMVPTIFRDLSTIAVGEIKIVYKHKQGP